jgi:hypothetical protein
LCSQCGPPSHHAETRSPFHFLPTLMWNGSEDFDTVPPCLLKNNDPTVRLFQ